MFLLFAGDMKIFVECRGRTKKLSFNEWREVPGLIAQKFGLVDFLLEYGATDSSGKNIWVEVDDEDDLTDGCSIRVTPLT